MNADYLIIRKTRFNTISSKTEAFTYIDEVRNFFRSCLGEISGNRAGYFLSANIYYPKANQEEALYIFGEKGIIKVSE